MKKIILATLGMGLLSVGFNASAFSTSSSVSPSLSITNSCSINTSNISASFAPQTSGTAAAANTITMGGGQLTVSCANTDYVVGANAGNYIANSGANQRRLRNNSNGTSHIAYKLTIDNGSGAQNWGDAGIRAKHSNYTETMSDNALSFTGSTSGDSFTIGGEITTALDGSEAVGNYHDSVTVTIAW